MEAQDATSDSVTVSWERPLSDGGSPVTAYHVEMKMEGGKKWNKAATTDQLSCRVTSLKKGKSKYNILQTSLFMNF